MAIVKHIKSRNATYSAAINYLLFEHDEKTGKNVFNELRRGNESRDAFFARIMEVVSFLGGEAGHVS